MRLQQEEEQNYTFLQQAQPAEVLSTNDLVGQLQKATARRKRNFNISWMVGVLTVLVQLATMPIFINIRHSATGTLWQALLVWSCFFVPPGTVSCIYTWLGKSALDRAITDLVHNADKEAIEPLLDMVVFYDPNRAFYTLGSDYRAYQAAVQALTNLLPTLSTEGYASASPKLRAQLPRALRHTVDPRSKRRYNLPFALAVLKALEEVGDGTAIPIVARLAQATPRNEGQRLLKEAAEICLARLRERNQEMNQRNSLLRAGSAAPTDTLLRATTETSMKDARDLLRAGQESPPQKK